MEGKSVIRSMILMSLTIMAHAAQIQVEGRPACPSNNALICYLICDRAGGAPAYCAGGCGCQIIATSKSQGYPNGYDFHSSGGESVDVVNQYCKLGCASSICGAITTLKNSEPSEMVNGAVIRCNRACAAICAKGSTSTTTSTTSAVTGM